MRKHTKQALEILAVAFSRWADATFTSQERVEIWGRLLEDVPADRLIAAAERLARTSKWAPTVSELREAAGAEVEDPNEEAQRAANAAKVERERQLIERRRAELAALDVGEDLENLRESMVNAWK